MTKIGIELGIRAPFDAILKASKIADRHFVDYFLVPETHPESFGVDAFETIFQITNNVKNVTVGTGIVNVFSRDKEEIQTLSSQIFQNSNGKFVLGLGTSAPAIIEKLWQLKFQKPISRLIEYTEFIKPKYSGPIFWAAVGKHTTKLATKYADGVIFFLKPKNQISNFIKMIESELDILEKDKNDFETVSIFPTYFDSSEFTSKMTLAGYIGANEFYGKALINEGFQKEVSNIREAFSRFGLKEASKKVSEKLVKELTITGALEECKEKILGIRNTTKLKTVILGFDLPEEKYDDDFFEKLDKFLGMLK